MVFRPTGCASQTRPARASGANGGYGVIFSMIEIILPTHNPSSLPGHSGNNGGNGGDGGVGQHGLKGGCEHCAPPR